ncbi:MAG: DUF2288 family protein [Desulfuromonadales bacterium]
MNKDIKADGSEEVEWVWLRPHAERDAVILVDPQLNLAEAAARIAADDSGPVAHWIAEGLLGKPSGQHLAAWDANSTKRFRMQIVQPYVLIQEIPADAKEENRHDG